MKEEVLQPLFVAKSYSIIDRMPAPEDLGESVVRQLMEGRNVESGFRWLFHRYHAAVYGFFSRKGFAPEDCRDLTQEVFIAVHGGICNLRHEAAFVAWLFSIARHMTLRHLEVKRKHVPLQAPVAIAHAESDSFAPLDSVAAPDPDPLRRMLEAEKVEILRETLAELPGREQECLRARIVEGLGYREIGDLLGISENTVAVHLHRGMKSLRNRLRHLRTSSALRRAAHG